MSHIYDILFDSIQNFNFKHRRILIIIIYMLLRKFQVSFDLIETSLKKYEEKQLSIKLWYRFWRCIEMQECGLWYQEVLETLFGAKSRLTKSHKKNIHFNNVFN